MVLHYLFYKMISFRKLDVRDNIHNHNPKQCTDDAEHTHVSFLFVSFHQHILCHCIFFLPLALHLSWDFLSYISSLRIDVFSIGC